MTHAHHVYAHATIKKQVVEEAFMRIIFSHTRALQHIVECAARHLCGSGQDHSQHHCGHGVAKDDALELFQYIYFVCH